MGPAPSSSDPAVLAAATAERQQLEELFALVNAFDLLQKAFGNLASAQERKDAEGRRCILEITGLKYHTSAFYFEVEGSVVKQVDPFEKYTTYISAPLPSIVRVLKGVLDGDVEAFSKEWARGQAKLVGDHSIHDGFAFHDGFRRLARMVRTYKRLVQQG